MGSQRPRERAQTEGANRGRTPASSPPSSSLEEEEPEAGPPMIEAPLGIWLASVLGIWASGFIAGLWWRGDQAGWIAKLARKYRLWGPGAAELAARAERNAAGAIAPINIETFAARIIEGPRGMNLFERSEVVVWRRHERVEAAIWTLKCLSNPKCAGSSEALEAIARRRSRLEAEDREREELRRGGGAFAVWNDE